MNMTNTKVVHAHGAHIPKMGLGTSPMTGELCVNIVAHALRAGYRMLDTAVKTGNELEVGEGIRQSGVPRDEVFVVTKVWRSELGDGALQRSAQESLARLKLQYVDLLLVHWPNEDIDLAQTMAALASAQAQGLARHIGVANFPSAMFRRAVELCPAPLAAHQCEYHPRINQAAVLAATREAGAAFIAFSPLGRGDPAQGDMLGPIARRHGVSESQVLLRWNVQQDGVCAIPRTTKPERLVENLAALDFELSDDEMAAVSALARPDGRIVSPPFAPAWD